MSHFYRKLMCGLLVFCFLFLCSCGPTQRFLKEQERGLYPTAGAFPNTKWVCNELDLFLCFFDYDEEYVIGAYTLGNDIHRVVATFEQDIFNLEFYSHTNIFASKKSSEMISAKRILSGFITTKYQWKEQTQTIECEVIHFQKVQEETIPNILTFRRVGDIATTLGTCWQSQQGNMTLQFYEDIPEYFTGEIKLQDTFCYIHAFEVGNNNVYWVAVENGKVNNLKTGTTSLLIPIFLEKKGAQMVAKVCDDFVINPEMFPDWPYGVEPILFEQIRF